RLRADTLEVSDQQKILRLLVKEILVGKDTLVIRHSITIPNAGPDPITMPPPPHTPPQPPMPLPGTHYLLRSGRHQSVAVQYLSGCARPRDGGKGHRDGAVRGRLRGVVWHGRGSSAGAGRGATVDGASRTDAASGQDANRGCHPTGWLRLSRLPFRARPQMAAPKE